MVVRTSSVVLPEDGLSRRAPRPVDLRQEGYDAAFDYKTLFYDVFESASGVTLVGPPLLNLESVLSRGVFTDGRGNRLEAWHNKMDRTAAVRLIGDCGGSHHVSLSSPSYSVSMPVNPNFSSLFQGKKVLVTKSKDNLLNWISDWVKFHVAEQGIDAVLFYDNGSSSYVPEDVLEVIAVAGVDVAVVVDWPFKFGPQGGNWDGLKGAPWDSDYCEYGIMEHARRRFLGLAAGVLNADIDELVLTEGSHTVFDLLAELDAAVLSYSGRWIEGLTQDGQVGGSHSDYVYFDPKRANTTDKWALVPSKVSGAPQWKTHWVPGVDMTKTGTTLHRHFMGVTLNWKWQRTAALPRSRNLEVDLDLREALARVFPDRVGMTSSR